MRRELDATQRALGEARSDVEQLSLDVAAKDAEITKLTTDLQASILQGMQRVQHKGKR